MDKNLKAFEDLIRKTLQKSEVSPSSQVLRKLRFRLWASEFFGLNLKKMNILYAGLIIGGIAGAVILSLNQAEEVIIVSTDKAVEERSLLAEGSENTTPSAGEPAVHADSKAAEAALVAGFESAGVRGCAPLKMSFSNQSVHAVSYMWDFGTGDRSNQKNPEYTYKEAGTYSVVLTVKDEDGNKASFRKKIEVLESPVADFEISIDNSNIETREILFNNNSEGASAYSWDFGDEKKSSVRNPVHAYSEYEVFKVRLIAKAPNGCTDTLHVTNKFIAKNYMLIFPMNFRPYPFDRGDNGYYERAGGEASIFYPKNNGAKDYHLIIKAPNGTEIFSTRNIKQGWNGYIGGRLAPRGIYTYEAKGTYPNGQSFVQHGRFEVLMDDYY